MYTSIHDLYVCMYVCMYAGVYACMHACMYAFKYMYAYVLCVHLFYAHMRIHEDMYTISYWLMVLIQGMCILQNYGFEVCLSVRRSLCPYASYAFVQMCLCGFQMSFRVLAQADTWAHAKNPAFILLL